MASTYLMIDSIVDEIINTLETNITSLGGTEATKIIEGDELPERVASFPSLYVIPLIEGGDSISYKLGDVEHRFHDFTVTIVGLYKGVSVPDLLRSTRQYGYTASDLFTSTNYKIVGTSGAAVVTGAKVEIGYHRVSIGIIHTWSLKLTLKSVTA